MLLVIIGTYCLFTAGSIFVLKALKKNRNYYYDKKHLPGVSGLLYRMKQNAVGLASICILATGVLLMISTIVSLYSGLQETLDSNYPQDQYLSRDWYGENDVPNQVLLFLRLKTETAKKRQKYKKVAEALFRVP